MSYIYAVRLSLRTVLTETKGFTAVEAYDYFVNQKYLDEPDDMDLNDKNVEDQFIFYPHDGTGWIIPIHDEKNNVWGIDYFWIDSQFDYGLSESIDISEVLAVIQMLNLRFDQRDWKLHQDVYPIAWLEPEIILM